MVCDNWGFLRGTEKVCPPPNPPPNRLDRNPPGASKLPRLKLDSPDDDAEDDAPPAEDEADELAPAEGTRKHKQDIDNDTCFYSAWIPQ